MSSEWDKTLLGELIKHKKGYAFKSKDYIDAGTPVIRVSNFTDDSISPSDLRFVDQSVAALNKDVELNEYDIVIATVGSWPNNPASVVGRSISVPSWASGALMNQNAVILRAKTNNPVDQRFLYFQTKSDEFSRHVVSKAQGSANQASITLDAIFSFPIFWPEYFARKEISNFLSAIDDRINLLRETNTTLEAIAQALFKSWFVDFDPVHANAGTQAPSLPPEIQALFPATFTDTPQGPIPEGWDVLPLGDVVNVTKGKSYSSKELVESHTTALVTLKSFVRGGGFRMDGFKPYSGSFKNEQVVKAGDLIVAYTDVTQAAELIGKPAIVVGVDEYDTLVASLDVGVIRPKDSRVTKSFLYGMFCTESFQTHTYAHTSGSTVLHLSKDAIATYPALIPNKDVIELFTETVSALEHSKQLNSDKVRSLSALRDSLLPRLISGQLRLPEAEQAIAAITD